MRLEPGAIAESLVFASVPTVPSLPYFLGVSWPLNIKDEFLNAGAVLGLHSVLCFCMN